MSMLLQELRILPATDTHPTLTYCLFCEQRRREEGEGWRDSFSLLLRSGEEVCLLSDITSERAYAIELLCLFAGHTVTPCGAVEVMEELLSR